MHSSIEESLVRVAEVDITSHLLRRADRASKLESEVAAFQELAALMSMDARGAVRRFLQLSLQLCSAGSAGVSMLRRDDSGDIAFQWEAVDGEVRDFEGVWMSRNASCCGLCIDRGGPILVSNPGRALADLSSLDPPISEGLFVPLFDNARHALGTLWVAHHDRRQFVPNDLRVLEQLASQLVLALKLVEERKHHLRTLNAVNERLYASEQERRRTQSELQAERERRERAETSESGLWEALNAKDALIKEVHHRVKNSIQVTASLLSLQARAASSAEAGEILREAQSRLQTLAKVHELLYRGSVSAQEVPMPTLLSALATGLQQTFPRVQAVLQFDMSDIVMHPDQAIPVALFTNEALTNAYKHAFPEGHDGHIRIALRGESDHYLLNISDDGVGVPTNIGNEGGLGIKLMKSFSTQLRGAFKIEPASTHGTQRGTQIALTIPAQLH